MRYFDQEMVKEYRDADQGGSDFIDSLPTPEIKTTEDLIAAATPAAPAAPAPKPTDAMLRGKEMSQTQFEGMEPVYQSYEMATRGDPGILLGYKYGMSQIQEPGMTASYSAPVYESRGRGGAQVLVDPGGKFLGYQYTGIIDAPKSAEILAIEKQLGKEVNPIYATRGRETRGGEAQVAYGPPIGYSYDNGKSQIVSLNTAGEHQSTVDRGNNSGFFNFALSMLSLAYPPIAPFIQAYNAVKAIDSGDTLGFILSAAGASAKIPGLDKSTISMLNDVSTGAKIIKAVDSKDPLAIASSMVNLPGVDPSLKDLSIVVNTAKALNDGNISGAFNGILKMSDRDSIGRLTDKFNDIVEGQDVAALDPSQVAALNPAIDENINATLTNAGLVNSDVIDKTSEEQAQEDREQAARDAIRASERNIEDTLTDSGLVSTDSSVDTLAQEQADREQAARDAIRAQEQAIQLAQEQEDREQAAREAARESERAIEAAQLAQEQAAQEKANREQADLESERVAQADREQAARDAVRASEKTIEDQLADSGLVSKTDDEKKLDKVDVSGKALTDIDLPITGDQGRNRVTDSSLPVNPNIGTTTPTLERKEISGKREIDTDLPITSDTGGNRVTDSSLPVNPNVGTTDGDENKLKQVEIRGKREVVQELEPVTITGKREIEQKLDPVTIVGKKETPVVPKPPVIPKLPVVPVKPTVPVKPVTPKKPVVTPEEQFYQTITQSNPTPLADIKYYLDMASGGMVPPENSPNPLESLLNQPMSVEELLYHLRS